ncbi:MAG TPA: WD40 repeat domain-containing serine/threonine-protein kinase [Leptolyngbyaceae cyanobacterium]
MICCINPHCQQPLNPVDVEYCQSCGTKLERLLRNRYRVIRPLGQGGFGKTYLAADEDMLQTNCVIKQFSPQTQGTKSLEKAVSLFNQEAVRLHQLGEHPQIPTLLAYFEHDRHLYLVQQFIEGQNLYQELQQQGPFNEEKIKEILLGLLPVLKFIHDRKVIHRDITPANVIRRQIDGRLVLIDFGIAKQLTEASAAQTGTRIGTEGYAPIEQLRNGQVYPASDLYSLGATCIFLMTQTKPDHLYNPLDGTWIWQEHLKKRGINVSDRLANIINKMLKDWVIERYQSAEEVLKDLNVVSDAPPISIPAKPTTKPPMGMPPAGMKTPPVQPGIPNNVTSKQFNNITSKPAASQPPISRNVASKVPVSPSVFLKSKNQKGWKCINTLTGHTSWIVSVAISPNKQIIASGALDDTIKIWNAQTGELLQNITGQFRAVNSLAITPDSQILVSGSDDDKVRVWSIFNGRVLYTLGEHSRDVTSVSLSKDGQILASGSEDRTIKIWRVRNGSLLRNLVGVGGMIKAVAISPDGKTLASGGLDNQIKLWNMVKGESIATLSGHFNSIHAIAFTPDGKYLASASKDKNIKLWSVEKAELVRTFSGHSAPINALVIHPDGQTMISAGNDKMIKVWRIATGEEVETLTDHTNQVNALAISADGQILVSGSSDKTIKIWLS